MRTDPFPLLTSYSPRPAIQVPYWHDQAYRAPSGTPDTAGTRVVIEARPGREPLEVVVRGRGVVPFEHLRSEEDIIRVLARGADAFAGIYDPRHRNA